MTRRFPALLLVAILTSCLVAADKDAWPVFRGDPLLLFQHLLEDEELSGDDLSALKKMIDQNKEYMVDVRSGQEFDKARHQAEKSLEEIEALFPQVTDAIAGSDFGQDAVKKARAVVERTRQAIAAKDLTTLADATEALNRTLNMFRGVVSKTRG